MANGFPVGSHACKCGKSRHEPKMVVLTGGPGGGKTAVLEMARRYFCGHVAILPEAASVVFKGGFPRIPSTYGRRVQQRAIFQIQRQLEALAIREHNAALILCDRGSLDGLAYWPGSQTSFFEEFGTSLDEQLRRYAAVIHMEVPAVARGYEKDRIRRESAKQARLIDRKIAAVWHKHPRVMTVGAQAGFLDKLAAAIELIRGEVPECCQTHLHATASKE